MSMTERDRPGNLPGAVPGGPGGRTVDFDDFSQQIIDLRQRLSGSDGDGAGASKPGAGLPVREISEAFDAALEAMRVARDELAAQNALLLASRQALEDERRRYRDFFERAPDGYLVTDTRGVIREFNQAAAALLGIDGSFLAGKSLAAFVPEAERHEFRSIVDLISEGTDPRRWEARLTPRHGSPMVADLSVSVTTDPHGVATGLLWQIRDVSAQKRTEDQLRTIYEKHEERVRHRTTRLESEVHWKEQLLESERTARAEAERGRLRKWALVDGLGAVVYEAEVPSNRFTFVSRHSERYLGYPAEAWLADPDFWKTLVHPDDRDTALALREKSVLEGRDFELEYRVVRADGRTAWVREVARVETDEDGRAARVRGLLLDMNRRKRTERNLYYRKHEVESRLLDMGHLHELSVRLLSKLELPAVLEEVLKATTSIQGADMGAVWHLDRARGVLVAISQIGLQKDFFDRVGPLPTGTGVCGLAVAEQRVVVVEDIETDPTFAPFREQARGAGVRSALSVPLFAHDGSVHGALAIYFREPHRPRERPMELVKMYALLASQVINNAQLQQRATERATSRDDFLRVVSRELMQPLAAIRNVLRSGDGGEPPQALAHPVRAHVERQLQSLTKLADDLVTLAHINRGEFALRPEKVTADSVIASAVNEVRPALDAKGQSLSLWVDPKPWVLDADPVRLKQVVVTLLDNASKHSARGAEIALSLEAGAGEAVIRVRDPGAGIAPEQLAGLFSLERRAASGESLGVSLALCGRLVELHRGRIEVASAGFDRGTEFTVRLPIPADQPVPPPPAGAAIRRSAADLSPVMHALVVEDDPHSASTLARLLRIWGYHVRVAADGPTAIEEAGRREPDVVLLDIGLPGMNGHEVAQSLRKSLSRPSLILAVTGYSHPQELYSTQRSWFDDYLIKPIDLDVLQAMLARWQASRPTA
jgi:PAS domain S-box-containing protein